MTLPILLSELAVLLPERVRVFHNDTDPADVWVTHVEVKYEGWREVWTGGDMPYWGQAWALEAMLREECEARGWGHRGVYLPEGKSHTAMVRVALGGDVFQSEDSTPAEALAAAVRAALKAEKGEG